MTSDAQSTFGSLGDILSNIPSVDVDPTGIVSLRGDILIDGKPSNQFSGASAGDNLQSIPAKDIERIEILTNPPVQYKADGVAGVINIITRRNHQAGSSGSIAQTGAMKSVPCSPRLIYDPSHLTRFNVWSRAFAGKYIPPFNICLVTVRLTMFRGPVECGILRRSIVRSSLIRD